MDYCHFPPPRLRWLFNFALAERCALNLEDVFLSEAKNLHFPLVLLLRKWKTRKKCWWALEWDYNAQLSSWKVK